ncbi:MAG: DNA polymerase/3'-5' exonuclease PolX [Desulfobacterales bacterium]|nr:DNA polymerase/3'-5' exonuclease PolX [Desulfobacterales bacterium]
MPIQNADIAEIFSRVANLLEIEGANQFRVRAYRNAARTVGSLPRNAADMVEAEEDLSKLPGIGKDLAGKIAEIVKTGSLDQLEELEERTPAELNELMNISGLGPKRVSALYHELGVTNRKELKAAAEKEKIRDVEGFGKKTEQSILEELSKKEEGEKRVPLMQAEQRAAPLIDYLKNSKGIKKITVAGSYRRCKETVGDLDILVTCKKDSNVMDRFADYEDVEKVVSKGSTRSTVVLKSGLQVDVRVLPQVGYGAGLHYFTGSKAHNIAVRKRGVDRKFKINEYGVFKGKERVAGKTEEEVYEKVGLPYIEPELREDRGEIEAAEKDSLPNLVRQKDIRGDLHAHTKATDGQASLEEMAKAAKKLGYDYLAVTDHSKKVTMAKGLNESRLADQIEEIDRLNEKLDDFRVLKGIEVDILEDGSLDLPDDILKELDVRVCSVHYSQNLSRKKQTKRVLKAMENPYFNILGHPTGRIIGQREPYEIDLEEIMKQARENGCFLELNAEPDRLDLTDTHCKMAKEIGVKLAISTDAHSTASLEFMRFGIGQARRGWLEADDVLNTRSLGDLMKLLKRA